MTKSTVTTEAIAGVADLNAGYTLGNADVAILKALAAELLAVREAQSGWTNNGQADAALVMLDRIDTIDTDDDERIEEVKRIVRLLAAPPAPAVPADVIDTLRLALDAMEFMGDTLNELDAATPDGIVRVTPAFSAVREMLAAAPTPTK